MLPVRWQPSTAHCHLSRQPANQRSRTLFYFPLLSHKSLEQFAPLINVFHRPNLPPDPHHHSTHTRRRMMVNHPPPTWLACPQVSLSGSRCQAPGFPGTAAQRHGPALGFICRRLPLRNEQRRAEHYAKRGASHIASHHHRHHHHHRQQHRPPTRDTPSPVRPGPICRPFSDATSFSCFCSTNPCFDHDR